jgi:RNA-binding motif X-linked protein 2
MQAIRATQALNKAELENATPPNASWHRDYKDTAYVYVGGLPLDLSEGDVVTIFSQYGNPTHLNLIRDKETGKSKGFAFLKYEDQRSCDLAVDNLGGAKIFDRMLRVDHTRYKKRDDEDEETYRIDRHEDEINGNGKRSSDTEPESEEERKRRKKPRKLLKEEQELEEMLAIKENGEDEDPMREYLIKEKRDAAEAARQRADRKQKKHKHRHRTGDGEDTRDKDASKQHRSSRRRDDDDQDHRHHRSSRHADGDRKERNHRSARRESPEDRSPPRQERSGKYRDSDNDRSDDGARLKPKDRPRSRDRLDTKRGGRSRSPKIRSKKPRDDNRDRERSPYRDREREHRHQDDDKDTGRRRGSPRERRHRYEDDRR